MGNAMVRTYVNVVPYLPRRPSWWMALRSCLAAALSMQFISDLIVYTVRLVQLGDEMPLASVLAVAELKRP